MRRVLVIGSSGAGKTTLALELGELMNLPVYHLDKLFWKPGWVTPSEAEWLVAHRELVTRERWIIEGTFHGSLDLRLARAETVIFLDFPRWLCVLRTLRRIAENLGQVREHMAEGCPERLDFSFLKYVWRFRTDIYPKINASLNRFPKVVVITLKSSHDSRRLLNDIRGCSGIIPT